MELSSIKIPVNLAKGDRIRALGSPDLRWRWLMLLTLSSKTWPGLVATESMQPLTEMEILGRVYEGENLKPQELIKLWGRDLPKMINVGLVRSATIDGLDYLYNANFHIHQDKFTGGRKAMGYNFVSTWDGLKNLKDKTLFLRLICAFAPSEVEMLLDVDKKARTSTTTKPRTFAPTFPPTFVLTFYPTSMGGKVGALTRERDLYYIYPYNLQLKYKNNISLSPLQPLSEPLSEPKFDPKSPQIKLTELLKELILRNNPNARVQSNYLVTWSRDLDLMIRIDKRDPKEIERLIRWSQEDDFWYKVILSMGKFRKQYDTLFLKSKKPPRPIDQKRKTPSDHSKFEKTEIVE